MPRLRVATYNLYLGADLARLFGVRDVDGLAKEVGVLRSLLDPARYAERCRATAAILARERPDLVGLQEVSRWTSLPTRGPERVLVDVLPMLLAELDRTGVGYDARAVNPNFGGSLPVSAQEAVGLAGANVTLVRRGAPVEVVGEAAASFGTTHRVVTALDGVTFPVERSWGRVDVRLDGRPLRFVNTHTEAWDDGVRDAQRGEVLEANAGVESPVVLVGDLNARPDVVGLPTGWTDAWSAGEGDGLTCGQAADLANPASTLSERIDYVWVRGATVLTARTAGDRPAERSVPHGLWPSDHACVVADLEV